MILTLIASNSSDTTDLSEIVFTSGIDGTYDEYMFVYTDIGPATDNVNFTVQFNADGAADYDEELMSIASYTQMGEDVSLTNFALTSSTAYILGTGKQMLAQDLGNGATESASGILHLYRPSNTTYVKTFMAQTAYYDQATRAHSRIVGGYINITEAVTDIQFAMSSGNLDGLVQMYGVA